MTDMFLLLGLLTGVAAAARSTWSPCGLSMLSTITPFGERGRGHRYGATASWFFAGAVAGGATLGAVAAGVAALVGVSGLGAHPAGLAAVAAVLSAGAAAVDAGLFGAVLPLIRRQVDDGWLAQYRPWVYGAGFGWQIGVGVATYLMTSAVLLVAAFAAFSASPVAALVIGAGFGAARGLTVFLTAGASSPARLRSIHGVLDAAGPTVRGVVVGVQTGAALALALVAAGVTGPGVLWLPAALLLGGGLLGAAKGSRRAAACDAGTSPGGAPA